MDSSLIGSVVKQFDPRIPGLKFSSDVSASEFGYRIHVIVGDAVGRDIIVWNTSVEARGLHGDNDKLLKEIARPIEALKKVVKDAESLAYTRGLADGRKAAFEGVRVAAAAFAETFK